MRKLSRPYGESSTNGVLAVTAVLIQVLLLSPMYASAQPVDSDQEENNNLGDS